MQTNPQITWPSPENFPFRHLTQLPTSAFTTYILPVTTLLVCAAVPFLVKFLSNNRRSLHVLLTRFFLQGKSLTRPVYNSWRMAGRKDTGVARPVGLENLMFACYQNATIQAFASLESIARFLERVKTDKPNDTANILAETIRSLNTPGKNYMRLPYKLQTMDTFTQQDATEYFSGIEDALMSEYLNFQKRYEAPRCGQVPYCLGRKNRSQSYANALQTYTFNGTRHCRRDTAQ